MSFPYLGGGDFGVSFWGYLRGINIQSRGCLGLEFSPIGGFSIRSAYDSPISLVRVPESRSKLRFRGMVRVWKSCALSKAIIFSKHLL